MPGGSNICRTEVCFHDREHYTMGCEYNASRKPSVVLDMIRARHPECEQSAKLFMADLPSDYERGMGQSDKRRHAQALAYLVFRDRGSEVTVAQLAKEIQVPEERLSRDVKALRDQLGIKGFAMSERDDNCTFKLALLKGMQKDSLRKEVDRRAVMTWCCDLFAKAVQNGETELQNMASRHQIDAIVVVYCETHGSPFQDGVYAMTKKRPRSDTMQVPACLTKNPTTRIAMAALRRHVKT